MSLSCLLPEATAAIRKRYGDVSRNEIAARRLERELYDLDALAVEQLLPVPQPTLAPDLWHCPHCLLPVPEHLGAINAHVHSCEGMA